MLDSCFDRRLALLTVLAELRAHEIREFARLNRATEFAENAFDVELQVECGRMTIL